MNAPERIYNWTQTQLSIAKHYGGCKFNGAEYVIDYKSEGQPLVRIDMLKRESKAKARNTKDNAPASGEIDLGDCDE